MVIACRPSTRALLAGLVIAVVAGCAAMIEEASRGPAPAAPVGPVTLVPYLNLREGMLTDRLDPAGLARPGPALSPARLLRPVAVAAREPDLLVADAAAGVVYRIDPATRLWVRLPQAPVQEGVRMRLGVDRVLHLLERHSGRITRVLPDGRPLAPVTMPALEMARAVDLAVEEPSGAVWLADGLQRQLARLSPSAGAWQVLSLRAEPALQPRTIERIAIGPRQVYLSDPQCACVWIVGFQGDVLGRIAPTGSGVVAAMAIDAEGRLYAADPVGREIRVLVDGRVVQSISYRSLGVFEIADLQGAGGVMWIVDPVGAQVEGRRIVPRTLRGGAS